MLVEFSLNGSPEAGHPSLAEVAWSTEDVDQALSLLPDYVSKETRREACRLLQPWPDGRYTDAYRRTGGILNLFTPPWGEQDDEVWVETLAGWHAGTFPDEESRQEALRALEQQWNNTPHSFFAGLTPAQVMVGGGHREAELAQEFLERLKDTLDEQPFASEGEALVKTLILLRGWGCQPRKDGRTPLDIIVAERNELLARRDRALEDEAG
jgi:hypothetical protein